MSTETPLLETPEDGPVFPNTSDWQWICHYCYLTNTSSTHPTTYGTCRRCSHERCRDCKITWEGNAFERSPQSMFRGAEKMVKENRRLLELCVDRLLKPGGLGKGIFPQVVVKGKKGAVGWKDGDGEVEENAMGVRFDFDFGFDVQNNG